MFNYGQIKSNLFMVVERLNGAVREKTVGTLSEVRAKLEHEAFNLVILGQFKRGKSTFINALLGEPILPTAIVPLTSVVTILRYGPKLRVEVHYVDDRRQEVDLYELPAHITEKGNPRNKKGVKEVTVFYPSEYLKAGVRIIDTPGAGSVYSHNTDVAYAYLPHVDAAIFVVSADPPLSNSEHQFLKDVRSFVDKLFFVLNKIDQVSNDDRIESLEFTARINETIERILMLTSHIFQLKLKPFTSVETLSKKSDFYFLLKDDPVGLELVQLAVTSALPRFLVKKMILKNMQTAVAELLDRHCGRVRYDLLNRLNKTVKDFQQLLNEKIDLTLEGIRLSFQKALATHQKNNSDVEENLAEISQKLGLISTIREELLAYRIAVDEALANGS
jgi:tRNA U34 5-carboxymethylaminomethyl modifying GTPase MnmE/TrmE